MQYEIVQVGPVLVERFEAESTAAAIERLRTYGPNHNLFIMPLRYRVDPDNPRDAELWNRIGVAAINRRNSHG